jgi:glycosyltransferase involved in cell wall biosynthesis
MTNSISVITPSFQQGKFIERTVQSVINQQIVGIEYLVCDGGSEDETLSILQKYSDVLSWISEPDKGQADAVNKGLAMTQGDIIAWINSDDIYYPQALKRILDFFETNPRISVVYGQADWIDEFDNVIAPYPIRSWNYTELTKECYLCQPAVFFRRSLIERLGNLNIDLQYCMDYELWLRYGQTVSFAYLPVKLAGSRLYASNKTFAGRLAAHHEANYMLKETLGYSTQHWIFEYSKLQVEDSVGSDAANFIVVIKLLICAINNCWHLNKKAMPIVILKLLLYHFSITNLLSKPSQQLNIESIVLKQHDQI